MQVQKKILGNWFVNLISPFGQSLTNIKQIHFYYVSSVSDLYQMYQNCLLLHVHAIYGFQARGVTYNCNTHPRCQPQPHQSAQNRGLFVVYFIVSCLPFLPLSPFLSLFSPFFRCFFILFLFVFVFC